MEFSILSIGGIFLFFGAYFLIKGNIWLSTSVYFGADICWSIAAFMNDDTLGVILINFGVFSGFIAMVKMQQGIFVKDLKKN
jgi:uncharacterized membrane protein (GlpM family)